MATITYAPTQTYGTLARPLSRAQSLSYVAPPPVAYSQTAYPTAVSQTYSSAPYGTYGYARSATSLVPASHRLTGSPYGNLHDPYHYSTAARYGSSMRPSRYSTTSLVSRLPNQYPTFHQISFKRKGAFSAGITLAEAQAYVRLSNNEQYTLFDLNADGRGSIFLSIRWNGYPSMTYEVPLNSRSGRVGLQTLARRISRACVHYLQSNAIPIMWDRVELHHIEEISRGVWQPMLCAY